MPFFIPDRSNRPPDTRDDIPCRVAVNRDQLRTQVLADGRVAAIVRASDDYVLHFAGLTVDARDRPIWAYTAIFG